MSVTIQLGVWLSVGDNPPIHVGVADIEATTTTTADGITIEAGPAIRDALHQAADAIAEGCPNHQARQHRDGKEPWCNECHLTEDGREPRRLGGARYSEDVRAANREAIDHALSIDLRGNPR